MNIVYDYQIFSYQRYGGISRYINELARRCSQLENMNVTILALLHKNRYLFEEKINCCRGIYIPHFSKTTRVRLYLNKQISKFLIYSNQPDIVHHTYYDTINKGPKYKTVITVHDMIHERFPSFFTKSDQTLKLKRQSILLSDHIICISESTKNDLLDCYDIDSDQVSVVYLGGNLKDKICTENRLPSEQPYIFYVGDRGAYKNFESLVKVYATNRLLRDNFDLICFGGGSFNENETTLFHRLNISNKVKLRFGNDYQLANLYAHASVFVCPSLYEGFGIPVLEAMSCGCPVACSNTSSMPEIALDAASYFDPNDMESISNALEEVLFSDEHSGELKKKGLERAQGFSWKRCAEKTAVIYKDLIGSVP